MFYFLATITLRLSTRFFCFVCLAGFLYGAWGQPQTVSGGWVLLRSGLIGGHKDSKWAVFSHLAMAENCQLVALSRTWTCISNLHACIYYISTSPTFPNSILPSLRFLTVHTAVGLPGSSDTAISLTSSPWRNTRNDDLGPRPQAVYSCGVSSLAVQKKVISIENSKYSSCKNPQKFCKHTLNS